MSDDSEHEAPERQPLGVFFQQHRRGALQAEIEEELQELNLAVLEHGKKGSLTITIGVAPSKDGMTVFVTDDLKVNKPKADRGGSIMFPDAKGNLHRSDPNQMRLERFHVVETKNDDAVVVDTATGEVKEVY